MLYTHETAWLQPLFEQKDWELVYLDPSVMEFGKTRAALLKRWKQDWWTRFWSPEEYWRVRRIGDAAQKIGKEVEQDFKHDVARHFIERKLLPKIVGDRTVQREAVGYLDDALSQLVCRALIAPYSSVKELRNSGVSPDGSREKLESLVVFEGIIGQQPPVPESLAKVFPSQTKNYREIRFYACDNPPHFLKADDPIMGVQVDVRAYFQASQEIGRFLAAGWYPYVKVVGHYATFVGGVPFLDALAILFRRIPLLDSLLFPNRGTAEHYGFCATFAMMQTVLAQEQNGFRAGSRSQPTRATDRGHAVPGRWSQEQEIGRRRQFEMDQRLLAPLLWLHLCCKLNVFEPSALSVQAKPLFDCVQQYGQLLLEWSKELKKSGADSMLVGNQAQSLKEGILALLAPRQ